MPTVEGGPFPLLGKDFSNFVVILVYISNRCYERYVVYAAQNIRICKKEHRRNAGHSLRTSYL